MIIQTSKVYAGRAYIPKEVREKFEIKNGDTLIWAIEDNTLVLHTQETKGHKMERFKVNEF